MEYGGLGGGDKKQSWMRKLKAGDLWGNNIKDKTVIVAVVVPVAVAAVVIVAVVVVAVVVVVVLVLCRMLLYIVH
jgi:hypothetical protein